MQESFSLGKNNKFGTYDLKDIKAGIKKDDIDDAKLKNIFDAIDTTDVQTGKKDGVLDQNEIQLFHQKIYEFAKHAKDAIFSKREAGKLLENLGLKNVEANDLFALLKSFTNQSKEIKKTEEKENSTVIEYQDGKIEEIFNDGSKIITITQGNKEIRKNFDKDGKETQRTEVLKEGNKTTTTTFVGNKKQEEIISENNNTLITVIQYDENCNPESKQIEDIKNGTLEYSTYENSEEVKLKKGNTHTGELTIYSKDGEYTVETTTKDGKETKVWKDSNNKVVKQTISDGKNSSETVQNADGTKTITTKDESGREVTLNKDSNGKNVSQTVVKDGQTYTVEYDGQGNTLGAVVQNGESARDVAQAFGCDVNDLLKANKDILKGRKYFLAGESIKIPGEMNADEFVAINSGRQTKEQAEAAYAKYERSITDARLENKQIKEVTVDKDYANWTEYAKEMLKKEGIENPTKQQIVDRTNELVALNPDIQVPKKGDKINVTRTNQEILAEAQAKKEANETKQKQATELANKFYQIADDNSGTHSMKKMQAMFDNKDINADNIVAVLDAYDNQGAKKGDTSMIDTITSEIGAGASKQQRQVLMSVLNTLCQAATNAGVSQEDINFAKKQFTTSLEKEFRATARRTNPMEMENAINFLKGAIIAKQNEVENIDTQQAMKDMAHGFNEENLLAKDSFETARKEEGWTAKLGDSVCGWFGCNTIEDLRAKLGENSKNVEALIQAAELGDETKFKEIYKQTFGVEFDANKIAAREEAETKIIDAMAAQSTLATLSNINSNMSYNEIVEKLSKNYDQETINTILAGYSKGYRMPNASDEDKKAILLKFIEDSIAKLESDYQKLTNGKTLEQMQSDLETLTKSAYGTNDIGKAVAQFNANQETTEMITEAAAEIAVTAALMAVPGGQAFAAAKLAATAARWGSKGVKVAKFANKALKMANNMQKLQKGKVLKDSTSLGAKLVNKTAATAFNMAATGTATLGVDLSNGKSVKEATHKALMNMSFAGLGSASSQLAPKLMQTLKINSTLANEIAEEIINAAGSYGITTEVFGQEYGSTDAFVDIASGIIIARLSHIKAGQNPIATVDTPQPEIQNKKSVLNVATSDNKSVPGGKLGDGKFEKAKVETKEEVPNATPERVAEIYSEGDKLQVQSRDQGREIKHIVEDGVGFVEIGKKRIAISEADKETLEALKKEIDNWSTDSRDKAKILAQIEARLAEINSVKALSNRGVAAEVVEKINENVAETAEDILGGNKGALAPHSAATLDDHITNNLHTVEGLEAFKEKLKQRVGVDEHGNMHKYEVQGQDHAANVMAKVDKKIADIKARQANLAEVTDKLEQTIKANKGLDNETVAKLSAFIKKCDNLDDLNEVEKLLNNKNIKASQTKRNLQQMVGTKKVELEQLAKQNPEARTKYTQEFESVKEPLKTSAAEIDDRLNPANPELEQLNNEYRNGKSLFNKDQDVKPEAEVKPEIEVKPEVEVKSGAELKPDVSKKAKFGQKLYAIYEDIIAGINNLKTKVDFVTLKQKIETNFAHIKDEAKVLLDKLVQKAKAQKINLAELPTIKPNRNKILPEKINFNNIPISNRVPLGENNPGRSMNDLMLPEQKLVYESSYRAYLDSKDLKVSHNTNNVLTTDNLLHSTNKLDAILGEQGILEHGLIPRELTGNEGAKYTDGSHADTITPLSVDTWDIRENLSIGDYFDIRANHWNTNKGETKFMGFNNGPTTAGNIVIVLDKKSMASELVNNSFNVNTSGSNNIMYKNGLMGGLDSDHNYPTHRAIPIGAPANSIDRIIIDSRYYGQNIVNKIYDKIQQQGLDIKVYDISGKQLMAGIDTSTTPISINVSNSVKETFGQSTQQYFMESLSNGQTGTVQKNGIEYVIGNKNGIIEIVDKYPIPA